ncbi:DUF3619 family protein [Noviherbaspirillum aerium]|uniref:DUF3619 family protein n=1 Tax=Noviherbaspirillum aerium TaxID=2588497 RepID=UPI00124C31FF|nr:DUF3619 family protein [Noviherbaspirillum aerium]
MNTRELNFAYKIRHALNENLDHLPRSTADRLAAARKAAVSRKKQESALRALFTRPVLASRGATHVSGGRLAWLGRMGLAVPLIAVAVGLAGIYQFEQQRRISDTAELDAEMLADELPISAYLDQGFNTFLAKRGE